VNGESNAFICFLPCCFSSIIRGQDPAFGFFLALGISIKLVPLIFIVFLLYRRKFGYFFLTLFFSALLCFRRQ